MIDVIIVAKNEQRHLGAVLSAVASQENCSVPIQVCVVDNGSTDNTAAIATSNGAKVIQCQGSLGKARNLGIKSGTGEFVAFLDGHSVPSLNWATALIHAFDGKEDLGGCMGSIENICERQSALIFARESIFSSPDKLWHSTISGLNSTLPWMPTGNCMYSRKALEEAGFFTESLFRCEDTDLSWKVVLKGYQLSYVPEARVRHYDQSTPYAYLRKYYNYGAGAAELASKYGLQPKPKQASGLSLSQRVLDLCYKLGYKCHKGAIPGNEDILSAPASADILPTPGSADILSASKTNSNRSAQITVNEDFRRPFPWSANNTFSLSPRAIFWFVDDNAAICINLQSGFRIEFNDTSLLLFRLLVNRSDRAAAIKNLCSEFDVSESEAGEDIDQFTQQLLDEEILLQVSHNAGAHPIDKERAKV